MRTAAVVGVGLIGASVALALSRRGVAVYLLDLDQDAVRTVVALGGGIAGPPDRSVDIAVLAVPPSSVGRVLAEQQARGLAESYTDVASVKREPEQAVADGSADPASYVGGHPMAGGERSGPLAACGNLFEGRTWVLTPSEATSRETLNRALALVALCGAVPVVMESAAHDRAVALVSHAPHVLAALMAARLQHAPEEASRLAGQGVRDMTRIAGGDPGLWGDILEANAAAVADVLGEFARDLAGTVRALRSLAVADASRRAEGMTRVIDLLGRGNAGRSRLPVKPGSASRGAVLPVVIGDRPGELARLFAAVDEAGVNIEDISIDHAAGKPSGLVEMVVAADRAEALADRLIAANWTVQQPHPVYPGRWTDPDRGELRPSLSSAASG
ncbi:prephenate dehydrogenase [Streptomyces sp. NPDC092296]|uniref:prephenate dehydrogenase n=1 Tax=Streptomyces sp. NPDC092296 TaxID=3366012 RepID=UPI00380AE768